MIRGGGNRGRVSRVELGAGLDVDFHGDFHGDFHVDFHGDIGRDVGNSDGLRPSHTTTGSSS